MSVADRRAAMLRMWTDSEWPEVARFIGPNAEAFRTAWESTRERVLTRKGGLSWHFCWPALLLGFVWFFYRKLWVVGVVLLVLPIVAGWFLPGTGTLGALIAVAFMAKSTLVGHAVARIDKVKQAGGGYDEIALAGGVSVPGAMVGGAIAALLVLASLWAFASVFMVRG